MKGKRFSVEQIVAVLKQTGLGVPVVELIRQVGITERTLYRWKKRYKGLETDQVRQLRQLQEENARLKWLVAELNAGQDDVAGRAVKKGVTSSRRRPAVSYRHDTYRVSGVRAGWRGWRYRRSGTRDRLEPRTALRLRIREVAQTRVRDGYRKIRVLLNREGWKVEKKLGYRLYKEEGLKLRHKARRKRTGALRRRSVFGPRHRTRCGVWISWRTSWGMAGDSGL